jgi:hypothetical protein
MASSKGRANGLDTGLPFAHRTPPKPGPSRYNFSANVRFRNTAASGTGARQQQRMKCRGALSAVVSSQRVLSTARPASRGSAMKPWMFGNSFRLVVAVASCVSGATNASAAEIRGHGSNVILEGRIEADKFGGDLTRLLAFAFGVTTTGRVGDLHRSLRAPASSRPSPSGPPGGRLSGT